MNDKLASENFIWKWISREGENDKIVFQTIAIAIEKYSQGKTMIYSIQYKSGWLAAFNLFTQSIKFDAFYYHDRCLKNVIDQIDSKNEWLLLSVSVTPRFGLVFVLTLENVEILNVSNTLTLKQIFWKKKTFFKKTGVPFFSWKY